MSYIPDRKIMELTKQINDARELFEQAVAERDQLRSDLAAARALLRESLRAIYQPADLRKRIDAALGKDTP